MDLAQETRIYKNYRAALVSLRRANNDHSAQRRQAARKVTVDRYNIPYAELKQIIAKHDALNDITHEYGDDYLLQLKYEAAEKEFTDNPVPCWCGSTDMVRPRLNPSGFTIDDELNLVTVCFLHYLELEGKI